MKSLIPVAALIALGACNVAKTGSPGASGGTVLSDADARKIVSAAQADFTSGDAFKIMRHYAPGAIVFDPSHADPSSDRNVQTQWTTAFVGLKPADLVSRPSEVQVLDADTIVASGIASFTGEVNGHRDLFHSRYSQVFEKQSDGQWLIVHEHMSMPPAATPAAPVPAAAQ